jgi:1-acyl-sn-glycerol-3-phosphate acyltransferase
LLYYILKYIVITIVFLTMKFKVEGRENVPKTGSVLVVSNHLSVSDPILIGLVLGRKIRYMAKEELFRNKIVSYLFKYLGAFPVYRESSSRDALRQAGVILREGSVLGMFPEGKRSMQNELQTAQYGSALLACHSNVVILPIGITGTEKIRGLSWLFHRPEVTLTIGKPFNLPGVKHRLSKEILEQYSDILMKHIAILIPLKYRGKYANTED